MSRKQVLLPMLLTICLTLSGRIGLAADTSVQQLIADAQAQYEAMADYTCRLDKIVRKDGLLYEDPAIAVKYKKPRHYYFRWEQGRSRGREVIFVAGRHDDKLVTHPGGPLRFLTLHLDPEGPLAMKANRHSLRHSGMEKIMELIVSNYQLAQNKGIAAIRYGGEDCIDGKAVSILEGRFPADQGFYAHRIIVAFDQAVKLPVKVSIFDGSEMLVEEYVFHDLKINVGLTEEEFNPRYPGYNFF